MVCPNCGQEFEGARCPNCGRPVASSGRRVAAVLVSVFLAVPLGLFGTCAAAGILASLTGGFELGTFLLYAMLALVGLGGMAVAVRWANRLWGNR